MKHTRRGQVQCVRWECHQQRLVYLVDYWRSLARAWDRGLR